MGTAANSRSKLNHSRMRWRSVACPMSVSAAGRVISIADMSALDHGELHIGGIEPAALRDHAENALASGRSALTQKLIEHDENRCGAGVPACVEIGEPLFLRDARATHVEHVGDLAAEV